MSNGDHFRTGDSSTELPSVSGDVSFRARPASAKGAPVLSILVVDDSDGVRDVFERALRTAGHEIRGARDGVDALAVLERWGIVPDVVLTDLRMPRMGGVELAERLRELHPELPIVFVSGYTPEPLTIPRELQATTTFVQKPILPRALLAALTAAAR